MVKQAIMEGDIVSRTYLSEVKNEPEDGPMPTRLADADMSYHAYMVQEGKTLGQLQAQMQAIQAEMQRIEGAAQTWIAYLSKKYGLSNGDGIDPDGTIVRKKARE